MRIHLPRKKTKKFPRAEYNKYLKSPEWKKKRELVFDTYGRTCSMCGSIHNLEIHHKHYKNLFKEKIKDLMVLCEPCHSKIHRDIKEKKQNKLNRKDKYYRQPSYDKSTTTYYPDRKKYLPPNP